MSISFARGAGAGLGLLMASLVAGGASAQSMSTNSATYNSGYGRYNGQENRGIQNYSNRDANGNLLIVDGIIQGSSSFSSSDATGSSSYAGGVGGGSSSNSASAIGNNLNVVTQGNNNTVIINSTQINNGNIYAGAGASGGVGNAP